MATADGSYTPGLVACGHVTTVAARKSRTFRGILVVYSEGAFSETQTSSLGRYFNPFVKNTVKYRKVT